MRYGLWAPIVVLFCFTVGHAQTDAFVPGKSVGGVNLNASRAEVHKVLGKPTETVRRRGGLVVDTWLGAKTKRMLNGFENEDQDFMTVFFRAGRAVQIEFNAIRYKSAEGLSIESSLADFRKIHRIARTRAFEVDDGEGSGYMAYYFDDVKRGIAFSFGTQDYFDATIQPERLRVHLPNVAVIVDPRSKPAKAVDERPVKKN